jgi:hypothetical protein
MQGNGDGGKTVLFCADFPVQVGHPAVGVVVPDIDGLAGLDDQGLDALVALQVKGALKGDLHLLGREADLVFTLEPLAVLADQVDRHAVIPEDVRGFFDDGGQDGVKGYRSGEKTADLVDGGEEPVFRMKIALILLGLPRRRSLIFF